MAWTYNNYESQSTAAAKLTALQLHITEVSGAIAANISAGGGKSRGSDPLVSYLSILQDRRKELERELGLGALRPALLVMDRRGGD